jgi:arylsulfatase A-like enzyme/Tfp pilus assembly protein PilF
VLPLERLLFLFICPMGKLRLWIMPVLLGFGANLSIQPASAANRPNVLLITIDTLRADHVGCYGYHKIQTPTMDFLASDGVLFENCFAQAPLTLPSHCTLLTGTYPQFHGVRDNIAYSLDPKIETIATLLKRQGYTTGGFVSSYILNHTRGVNQGFDLYFDNYDALAPDMEQFSALVETKGERVLQEATRWIQSVSARPFFAWIHLYEPHDPYQPPEPFKSQYKQQPYDGEVAYTDSLLGAFLEFLKRSGLYDSSWIVLTSDHGESLGEHQETYHGYYIYNASMRVPLIFKAPGSELRGRRIGAQVRSVDIAPTLLSALKVSTPAFQGKELLSFMYNPDRNIALPAYSECFMMKLQFGWSELKSWQVGKFKYIEAPRPELYNLEKDPGEKVNLFTGNRVLANQYRQDLDRFYAAYLPSSGQTRPQAKLSAEDLQRLQSLGYVGGTLTPLETVPGEKLPDPKDKLPTYELVLQVIRSTGQQLSQAALLRLQNLIKNEPRAVTIYNMLGLNDLRNRRLDAALEYFKKALGLMPENPMLVYNLAFTYLQKKEFAKAAAGFERSLKLDPTSAEAYNNLGIVWLNQGNPAKAKSYYQQAIRVSPRYKYAHYNLGTVEFEAGNFQAASDFFNRAVSLDPEYAQAWLSLANTQAAQKQFEQALQSYLKVVALDPDQSEACYNLGLMYKWQGQWRKAQQMFSKVVALQPKDSDAHYNLGLAYSQVGQKELAHQEIEKACQLNPKLCQK